MSGFLKIKNWDKFQHYKDRNPPWIKLSTSTFQDYDFACLQDASKLLAVCYWTLAARSKEGFVPSDFEFVKRQCSLGNLVKMEHLKELIDKGFIIDASTTLADCKQSAIPETETETEKKEKKKKEKKSQQRISTPEELELDIKLIDWGKIKTPTVDLEALREEFVTACKAKGYAYVDCRAALQQWAMRREKENKKNGMGAPLAAVVAALDPKTQREKWGA